MTPPAVPPKTPNIILSPTDIVLTKFIDSVKINYSYQITSDKAINLTQGDVTIEAILENPEKWSKTYTMLSTGQNGVVNLSFPLDIQRFTTIFDTIQQETGIPAAAQNLTLKATVHTKAQTDAGPIDKTYTQSIKTNLRDGILTWSGDIKKTEPGSIEKKQTITEPATILGILVPRFRYLSVIFALMMLVLSGISVLLYIRKGPRKSIPVATQARQLTQKYKDLIVEIKEWPEVSPGQTILSSDSLRELIKVAQGLLKPVLHATGNGEHIFWVNDDSTRYEFRLGEDTTPSQETLDK
jgi:hypothetical protein